MMMPLVIILHISIETVFNFFMVIKWDKPNPVTILVRFFWSRNPLIWDSSKIFFNIPFNYFIWIFLMLTSLFLSLFWQFGVITSLNYTVFNVRASSIYFMSCNCCLKEILMIWIDFIFCDYCLFSTTSLLTWLVNNNSRK